MDYRSLTTLLVKITGAWLIVYVVMSFNAVLPYMTNDLDLPWWEYLLLVLLSVIVPLLIGLMILLYPTSITNRIISEEKDIESQSGALLGLEQVAVSVLGVYLFLQALSDIAFHITYIVYAEQLGEIGMFSGTVMTVDRVAGIVTTGFELLLAIWLIVGSKGIVKLISRIRR